MRSGICHNAWRLAWLALALAVGAGIAQAQQTLSAIVNGQVTMIQQGNQLNITNTPGSIINWQKFSIGSNELVRFIQQSAGSSVLNRVVGVDPSQILGALLSNGRVFLINPNGILFGAGAQINVAGLVASTLRLSDADFLAGRLRFGDTPSAGSIVNNGAITTSAGGQVYLIAPDISNSGVITSPQGEIILAAGKSVELVSPGTPNLRVEITAPDNQALNVGQIVADSGRVGIYAGLIRNTGALRADGAVVGQDGEILLRATRSITLDGTVSAGTIRIDAGEMITVNSGVITGGDTRLQTLNGVTVTTGSTLPLNGGTGGGTITLSGGNVGGTSSAGFLRAFVAKAAQSAQSIMVNGGPAAQTVINGLATFGQGTLLTTTNNTGAIINWQQFSIGAGNTTPFIQQSGSSSVLNRVAGSDASTILGTLQSNGQVLLINSNAVVAGGGIVQLTTSAINTTTGAGFTFASGNSTAP